MEILGEFDNESPLYVSFCKRISPEDFERQSLTYTQKSLKDLYAKMERNPGICESIVRKRKQLGTEEAGLASYLKAKVSSLFNHADPLEMEEIREQVEQLKREMQRASNYAFAAKRVSRWSLERRAKKNVPLGKFSRSVTKLPEPTFPAMPKIFGPYPTQMESSSNVELKQPWAGMLSINQVRWEPIGARTAANSPTEAFQNDGPSHNASVLKTPALVKPRGVKEDTKENKNPGPGSHPTGP